MDEGCEPMACQLPIISNGRLIPSSSAMVHASATIVCENGYLLNGGLRVSPGADMNFVNLTEKPFHLLDC